MNDIYSTSLLEIMPANLLADKKIRDICQSLDDTLKRISAETNIPALIYNIDTLDSDVIDILAWQFHVDFYDETLPLKKRRELVKKSIDYHRHKGTPYAMDGVVGTVFPDAVVEENWEYDGEPYHFRINSITVPMADLDTLNQLMRAIKSVKNVRSVLDEIIFKRYLHGEQFHGGMPSHDKTRVTKPKEIENSLSSGEQFHGGMLSHNKTRFTKPKEIENSLSSGEHYHGGVPSHNKIRNAKPKEIENSLASVNTYIGTVFHVNKNYHSPAMPMIIQYVGGIQHVNKQYRSKPAVEVVQHVGGVIETHRKYRSRPAVSINTYAGGVVSLNKTYHLRERSY